MMLEQPTLSANFNRLEQRVFRSLNAVVEPAVRKGFGSPTLAPAGLIVLETVGFKSWRTASHTTVEFSPGPLPGR